MKKFSRSNYNDYEVCQVEHENKNLDENLEHNCLVHEECDMILEALLYQDDFRRWYQYTKMCSKCLQRALTYVIHSDDILLLDRLMRWTNFHDCIVEVLLAACVHDKTKIVDWLLYLWKSGLFSTEELRRVFCCYQCNTPLEQEFAVMISIDAPVYIDVLLQIANVLEVEANEFFYHVMRLKEYVHTPTLAINY